jgi:hypothetical protein
MPKYEVKIISAPKLLNKFMVCCDVFEKGKVLGDISSYIVEADKEVDEQILIDSFKKAADESDRIVSFITVEHSRCIPYFNPEVRIVSNGYNFFMLHEWIEYNYPHLNVKINQYRFIESITL